MKVYRCDACEKVIGDPYKVKMKEFYIGTTFDNGIFYPLEIKKKTKVQLCDTCYRNLQFIANKVAKSKDDILNAKCKDSIR